MDSQNHKMTDTSSGKREAIVRITIETVASSIHHQMTTLSEDTEYTPCIYRVPKKRRKANEAAYTPQLVSIGPFHRKHGQLQGMAYYKLRCLWNFCNRFSVNVPDLVRVVEEREIYVRGCYQEKTNLKPEQFLEMILLDGIFIVELFLKNHFPLLRGDSDIIFGNHGMWSDLLHDMLLLENQLPMKVPKILLDVVQDHLLLKGITFYDLAYEFFKDVGNTEKLPLTKLCYSARHFVEFLQIHHSPIRFGPSFPAMNFGRTRSATELQQAGVKFRHAEGSCLFDVEFNNGELTLPSLTVNDWTETFFRNLIAFEQCEYSWKDITSYVIFMDNIINTPNDVDLLVKHGIIKNQLGKSKAVADLFNNLYKEVVTEIDGFYYAKLCGDLNGYSRNQFHEWKLKCFRWRSKWHGWIMILRHKYFGNPWSFLSLLAASVLLTLTVLQTVFSILPAK